MPIEVKGKRLGTVEKTLGLAESKEHNVSPQISVVDVASSGDKVYVEIHKHVGQDGYEKVGMFEATVTQKGSVSIPKEFIMRYEDIVPGRTIKAEVFERKQTEKSEGKGKTVVDNFQSIIGTATVRRDTSNSDDCSPSLSNEGVHRYLRDDEKPLKFKNKRTGRTATALSYRLETGNTFSFPYEVRYAIDAEPNDEIELSVPSKEESAEITSKEKDVEDMIAEMHGAIMEMYSAYLQTVDND